jgi:hypothetical protein
MPSEQEVADRLRAQRDKVIERDGGKPMQTDAFTTKVVGVSFTPHYPDNLHELNEIINGATSRSLLDRTFDDYYDDSPNLISAPPARPEPLVAILHRNPHNEYDANAIEVHVPALTGHGMIGHLTRPIAARIAPEMDAGTKWMAHIESVLIDPDHPDRPGITIKCERAPEQEN